MMLEKRELAWREEKREALAELDLAKDRMREEVLWDIFFAFLVHMYLFDFFCISQGLERNVKYILMIFSYFESFSHFFRS